MRWANIDIVGKRDNMRTVPMPSWAKATLDSWTFSAQIESGFIFRSISYAEKLEKKGIAPHDLPPIFR